MLTVTRSNLSPWSVPSLLPQSVSGTGGVEARFRELPFPHADYGALPGNDLRCADFNSGNPCSPVKGLRSLRSHGTRHAGEVQLLDYVRADVRERNADRDSVSITRSDKGQRTSRR